MNFIEINKHCVNCNISIGMKEIHTVKNYSDLNIDSLNTEEKAAEFICNFYRKINKTCSYCGSNNWKIYNISINYVRLRRNAEISFKDFLQQYENNTSFTEHLNRYYLENEKGVEDQNTGLKKVTFSQSFVDETETILEKFRSLFLFQNGIDDFRFIIENDLKKSNFGPTMIDKNHESVFLNYDSFNHLNELILEFRIDKNKFNEVISLRMMVSEGFFKLFQFLTSKISNSDTFVNYDQINFYNCYYITIVNNLQIKIFPIEYGNGCYEIKITPDLYEY